MVKIENCIEHKNECVYVSWSRRINYKELKWTFNRVQCKIIFQPNNFIVHVPLYTNVRFENIYEPHSQWLVEC